ncbi:uncharacterized protein LOC141630097 [Silene latifolia]|uniref:uncharacterized protein LOC141630097 n=1 Tax=Silene latifolia TaxID=37657 RepID=UPI003D76B15C
MAPTTSSSLYKDPLHLTSGDQSLLQLLPQVFTGKGFLHWSRNLRIALISKNKLGFVNGTFPQPPDTGARHHDWIRTDYTVIRWIQFSLAEDIAKISPMLLPIKQVDLSVAEYYAKLRSGWEDIRSLDPLPECDCGAISTCTCNILKKIVQRENTHHILDFLMGLHKKYDSIRNQILALDPLPNINQVYAKIHQAEVQLSITSAADIVMNTDSIALASNQAYAKNVWRCDNKKVRYDKSDDQPEVPDKPFYYSTRCKKHGHTLNYCWVHKRERAKKNATQQQTVPTNPGLGTKFAGNVEEVPGYELDTPLDDQAPPVINAALVQVIAKEVFKLQCQNTASTSASSPASGTLLAASAHVQHNTLVDTTWIIDSGASDHMTYKLSNLHHVQHLVKPLTVTLPDGQVKTVQCIGDVQLSDKLILHNVLYLPDFRHNLLSLRKLLDTPSLCANFHPHECFIQDRITKEILCSGLKFAGVYHLHSIPKTPKNKCISSLSSNVLLSNHVTSNDVYLLHARLGHNLHPWEPTAGRVEKKRRHLLEVARALRHQSGLPKKFWGDMILAATHIINLLPTFVLQWHTPHECLFGTPADYTHFKVIGCLCYAARHDGDKFEDRATRCIFLGYPMGKKGQIHFPNLQNLSNLEPDPTTTGHTSDNNTNQIHTNPTTDTNTGNNTSPHINSDSASISDTATIRKSTIARQLSTRLNDFVCKDLPPSITSPTAFTVTLNLAGYSQHYQIACCNVFQHYEPSIYHQAKDSPY